MGLLDKLFGPPSRAKFAAQLIAARSLTKLSLWLR